MTLPSPPLAALVARVARARGVLLTLSDGGTQTYNTATMKVSKANERPYAMHGIVSSYDLRHIDGTNIQANDLRVSISADDVPDGLTLTQKFGVTMLNHDFQIISIRPVYLRETIALWELQLRAA